MSTGKEQVPRNETTRVCADCGATEDLYFHEMEQAWVCEEVADCILKQKDDAFEEVARLRAEFVAKTAREHCHCDLEGGPCSVCRARAEVVANA